MPIPDYALGQNNAYYDLVKKGKPAAMLSIQEQYGDEAKIRIQNHGLDSFPTLSED